MRRLVLGGTNSITSSFNHVLVYSRTICCSALTPNLCVKGLSQVYVIKNIGQSKKEDDNRLKYRYKIIWTVRRTPECRISRCVLEYYFEYCVVPD